MYIDDMHLHKDHNGWQSPRELTQPAYFTQDSDAVVEPSPPFKFKVGETYETQCGDKVQVLSRTQNDVGYECLVCDDGVHRYDRSTSSTDAGRVTGTAHDYSHPNNFKR